MKEKECLCIEGPCPVSITNSRMRTPRVHAGTIVHQEGRDNDKECFTLKLAFSPSDLRGPAGGTGPLSPSPSPAPPPEERR